MNYMTYEMTKICKYTKDETQVLNITRLFANRNQRLGYKADGAPNFDEPVLTIQENKDGIMIDTKANFYIFKPKLDEGVQ